MSYKYFYSNISVAYSFYELKLNCLLNENLLSLASDFRKYN